MIEGGESVEQLRKWGSFIPAKQAVTLLDEFKNFAFKGNVIDLAIGVIIAGAFGKIIDALVKHIIMPSIGLLFPGEQGYLGWKFVMNGKEVPYGLFIGEVVNFIVVAAAIFIFLVKFLSLTMKKKKEEAIAPPPPPPPSAEQILLTEIRDILKSK